MATPSDVIVIGAGIVGCAVAYELARRGASVEIVDDRPAGMGATQASAGVLGPYVEAREEGALLELTARSLDLFDRFVARITSDSGLPVAYKRTGTLDVATDAGELAALQKVAALLAARGVPAELVDARAARELEPHLSSTVAGGLFIPSHGFVAASDLTKALVAAARRHGAQLIEHGRIRRIAQGDVDLRVETDRGSLTGGAVVVAAGSWSGQIEIAGARRAPVKPIRGQLLQLAWPGPPLRRVTWGQRAYMVPWDDGTLLLGATVEDAGFDERTTVAGVRDLMEGAAELVPQIWNATFQHARVGLRPATPDLLPIVGPSAVVPNLFYATGHYRNGVLLSALTAELVAGAMLDDGKDPALDLMRPSRFGDL
ncbi:MAG TPA: glycine oxidase ThiO [Vicinamibacterales bacterium]|nr:glycine oxidase ThiO [Vicinamibacterales bacterium]